MNTARLVDLFGGTAVPYPKIPDLNDLADKIALYSQLKHERGATGIEPILRDVAAGVRKALDEIRALPEDPDIAASEPDTLPAIRRLRPEGRRRIGGAISEADYREKLAGAFLARCAGCTLGAPVEGWSIDRMRDLAAQTGMSFPPGGYWEHVPDPDGLRYGASRRDAYTRPLMDGVPVDDDIAYTLIGLVVAEEYGTDFTTDDVAHAWLKYLPTAATAEEVALRNLKAGVPAGKAGVTDNPYLEWIGADIRSDPWGYLAPGMPEKAAEMAYNDAYLSHRRNGVYGEMYFSAVISAAFTVTDPMEALEAGLREIPSDCRLAQAVRWALEEAPRIRDYQAAADAVAERFAGMHHVHTINNACLTVWGIKIGGTDVSRVISQTVAMGYDNDCTAATAGSIVGAVIGAKNIPERWTAGFNNTVRSYLIGMPVFRIDDLVDRFTALAENVQR